jgi:DNA-binding NarL/FixJ family response regulator
MNLANVRYGTSPPPRSVATAVLGGDELTRRAISRQLEEAGFAVAEPIGQRSLALVLLLLTNATEAQRVGELREIAERRPSASVLAIMPADATHASLRRVLVGGARGIVSDDQLEQALVPTAHAILAGQLTVPSSLGRQIAPRPLSYREKEILALVTLGRTNREIAAKLFLAESTVKTHLSSAFRKLDARSRAEAVNRIMDPESGYGAMITEIANESLTVAR